MERLLRLVDCEMNFVKMLDTEEAEAMLASGKVEFLQVRRKRFILVLLDKRLVSDFRRGSDESSLGGAALQTIYRETHRSKTIAMMKRRVDVPADKRRDGAVDLRRWDNALTFEEVRAGQYVSKAARERMKQAEWRKQNLVIALTSGQYRGRAA